VCVRVCSCHVKTNSTISPLKIFGINTEKGTEYHYTCMYIYTMCTY